VSPRITAVARRLVRGRVVPLVGLLAARAADAQQAEGGPRLRAEIHGPTVIRFTLSGAEQPAALAAYRLTDGHGRPIPIAALRTDSGSTLVVPEVALDPMRVHYLEIPDLELRAFVRRDPLFRTVYSAKPLGAVIVDDGGSTTFRLFSPRAHAVRLYLYHGKDDAPAEAWRTVEMVKDDDGVWEATEPGDLHGTWYDFTVHGPDDPGNWFYETHPVHISDPYALVNDDAWGKSRVWRDGPPPSPVKGGRPRMEDVVAYEVHLQDFTDLLPVDPAEAGTLPAMARPGLVNSHGQPVGFDHLAALGVNVVHLMPMQEFLHYPDDAWRAVFANDPFARAMGIDRENYQWGYRTTHAFAVESRFRSRGAEPGAERDQFRALVRAFHERGIAVIVDLVPNHTGENMDHRHLLFNFNVLDLPYYYRTDDDVEHIGPFGNEVKSEERPMVQRWILDQMRHWVDALGVDGFRIDLAGQIDKQTLLRVKRELPDDLIIYGEPWIAPTDPDVRANSEWAWYKADAPITFFQDDARNAFQGSPFDVADRGWAGGDGAARDAAMRALANAYPEEPRTTNGISYVDIHDNWALADRYALRDHNGLEGVDLSAVRIAAGLLLTSAGPVVLHGGTEMLRSKGLAPLEEFTVTAAGGPIEFKGRDDTYNLRAPNRFIWESLAPGSDHVAMREWWRGLLALRESHHGEVFRVADVPDGHYRWITPDTSTLLGYVVGGRVLVLANSGAQEGVMEFALPQGSTWRQVADRERIDLGGVPGPHARLDGGPHRLGVPAGAFLVWVAAD
jgi:pullulanase